MRSFIFVTTTVLAVACATDPDAENSGGAGGKADGSGPVLTFAADYTETQSANLVAGASVNVKYDLARLTACRTQTNGSDVWGVTGYAKFADDPPVAFALSQNKNGHVVPVSAVLSLPPSATHFQLWFAISDKFGCVAYDSKDGGN